MYMTSFTQKILVDSNRNEFATVKKCEKDVVGIVKYTGMFHVNNANYMLASDKIFRQ